MLKKLFFLLTLMYLSLLSWSQLGGLYIYDFLEIPLPARAAALGSNMVPVYDKDITLALYNPSLLNPQMANYINACYTRYPAGINFGNAAYARSFKNGYMGMVNMEYVNYGKFDLADNFGNISGTFTGADYSLNFSASKPFYKRFIAGATMKLIYSTLESYTSYGFATDLGVSYHDTSALFTTSLVINNLGPQIKGYSTGTNEPLPLNVQLGVSRKFAHMPLRVIVIAHHLNVPDFTYTNPLNNKQNLFDTTQQNTNQRKFSEKIFRHIIVGGELVLSKNFFIRFGYDHQRRKEMAIDAHKGFTGFSWGFGIRVSKFQLAYANAQYHLAGASNYFSISANLADFYRKGKVSSRN